MSAGAKWTVLLVCLAVPTALSLTSPLLQWRDMIYNISALAGVIAMSLILLQAVAMTGLLPLDQVRARRVHRFGGMSLCVLVVVHVGGLWLTSPPDVIDALTFTSPTPFAPWGVVAMWAVLGSALIAVLRSRTLLRWRAWRRAHLVLASVVVVGTIVHAVLILGTMEPVSKYGLSVLVFAAFALAVYRSLSRHGV